MFFEIYRNRNVFNLLLVKKLIIQIAVVVGLIKSGTGSVRLHGKFLQHPNAKECIIELTDSVHHLLLICEKEFHVYLKNLTNHNVTPWLFCPPEPYFAIGLIDDKNELIVCQQKTIQSPIELWCEKSASLPKNYKCEDTYVFDDELPSTSATFFSLTNSSGILSSNASNQPVLDTSNVALGNVNNFIETKWMLLLGGFIGILLILLLLLLIIHYFKKVFLPKRTPGLLEKSTNEYLICNSCGAETQRKHTCSSQV